MWVEYLRHGASGPAAELDALIDGREVVTCGPVVAEILAGTSGADRERVANVLRALPWIELTRPLWLRAGALAAELRAGGGAVPLTDVEIAVTAISGKATLWTADSDFQRIVALEPELSLRPFGHRA